MTGVLDCKTKSHLNSNIWCLPICLTFLPFLGTNDTGTLVFCFVYFQNGLDGTGEVLIGQFLAEDEM